MGNNNRNRSTQPGRSASTLMDDDERTGEASPPASQATQVEPPVVSGETPPAEALPVVRQGSGDRPFCPDHLCLMTAQKSSPAATIYKCPVPACGCKEKRARPQIAVPREPKHCPQRTCAKSDTAFLKVEPQRTTATHVTMVCPECGFHMQQPRPELRVLYEREKRLQRRQGQDEDLGAR